MVPVGEECDDGNNVDGDGCSANCTVEEMCEFGEQTGWYAQYFNYLATHPDMNLSPGNWPDATHGDPESAVTPWNTDWYDVDYMCMTQVDGNLAFGDDFFPLDDTMCEVETHGGHEHHF